MAGPRVGSQPHLMHLPAALIFHLSLFLEALPPPADITLWLPFYLAGRYFQSPLLVPPDPLTLMAQGSVLGSLLTPLCVPPVLWLQKLPVP